MKLNHVPPRQHVECETCGEVFLDMDAWEYVKVSRCYNNRGRRPNVDWQDVANELQQKQYGNIIAKANSIALGEKGFYDKFFCNAVIHWCKNPEHTIIVTVPLGNTNHVQRYDMTKDFKVALAVFGSQYIDAERTLMENAYDETTSI